MHRTIHRYTITGLTFLMGFVSILMVVGLIGVISNTYNPSFILSKFAVFKTPTFNKLFLLLAWCAWGCCTTYSGYKALKTGIGKSASAVYLIAFTVSIAIYIIAFSYALFVVDAIYFIILALMLLIAEHIVTDSIKYCGVDKSLLSQSFKELTFANKLAVVLTPVFAIIAMCLPFVDK